MSLLFACCSPWRGQANCSPGSSMPAHRFMKQEGQNARWPSRKRADTTARRELEATRSGRRFASIAFPHLPLNEHSPARRRPSVGFGAQVQPNTEAPSPCPTTVWTIDPLPTAGGNPSTTGTWWEAPGACAAKATDSPASSPSQNAKRILNDDHGLPIGDTPKNPGCSTHHLNSPVPNP